jgi:hypothetical protein
LFEQVGALRDTLREMVQQASTHAAAPMRDGAARPAEGRSDESVASESRGHRAAPSGGASAEPAGLAHPSGNTPGNGPLSVPGRRQDGAPSTDPSWSEAAAAVSHAKTGQSVRLDLDRQAETMDRALDDALPALVRHAGRSSLAAPGKGGAGAADADRLHALMVAYAMAMSECAYIDRHNSRQRLRAACQHIVPHLGVMDTLLASAAAMDDYETVDKLFRLRKCLMVAHGDVQPPYLAFQAVPPPPELFREIGRALAASSMGAGKSSASGGGLLPSQRSALELMVEAGAIIERTVRALLALLQGREGRAAASHPLGPVLHLAVQRMGPAAGVDTLSREGFAIAHALLKSIEAEIGFASSHTPWPQEAELLQRLLEAITRIDALLQHDPILSSA